MGTEKISFTLKEPKLAVSKRFTLNDIEYIGSYSVLPGWDPRGIYKKDCQDNWIFLSNYNSFLVALFDGHGTYGLPAVQKAV